MAPRFYSQRKGEYVYNVIPREMAGPSISRKRLPGALPVWREVVFHSWLALDFQPPVVRHSNVPVLGCARVAAECVAMPHSADLRCKKPK